MNGIMQGIAVELGRRGPDVKVCTFDGIDWIEFGIDGNFTHWLTPGRAANEPHRVYTRAYGGRLVLAQPGPLDKVLDACAALVVVAS